MFNYDVRIKGERAYYSAGIFSKLICLFFAIFLTAGFVLSLKSEGFSPLMVLPLIFDLVLIFAFLYRDEWIFDNSSRTATMVFGIACFVKKTVISYDDIDCIEISHFLKGIQDESKIETKSSWRHPEQIVFSIRLSDEERTKYDLEIISERKSGGKIDRNASYLSSFTGLALKADKMRNITRPLR